MSAIASQSRGPAVDAALVRKHMGSQTSAQPRVGFRLLQRETRGRIEPQQASDEVPGALGRLLELGVRTCGGGLLCGKGLLARQHRVQNHAKAPTIDRLGELALRDFGELQREGPVKAHEELGDGRLLRLLRVLGEEHLPHIDPVDACQCPAISHSPLLCLAARLEAIDERTCAVSSLRTQAEPRRLLQRRSERKRPNSR
mmetsp:Transcript_126833/g.340359  ORF Transcript_126833/g.340359 Transcript_126833/m.340359 type:complete len:200 (+) Transcript_126833:65-664(+)